ncbi:MAG: methyltransferase domain-containing protein [Campylobacterota bacterium]|nr:methyltransferase domain-containing protein [Campylobacterota bacterium]
MKTHHTLASGNVTLDIACGMGRHSKYLAKKGFLVDALDISSTAIKSLQNIKNITAIEVDFDTYKLDEDKYDLIVCTYFLKRDLFSQILKALKVGGIFIYQTYLYHADNTKVPSNKSFLLLEGELEKTFKDDYTLLHISEYCEKSYNGDKTMIGSLVAKKMTLI